MTTRIESTDAKTVLTVALVAENAVLALRDGQGTVAVSLTPREADYLAGRLRKAASDLRAKAARTEAATP